MVKPRPPVPTVPFVDSYCQLYQELFQEVRSYEYFKYIHLGIISDIRRKSLPQIARAVGLENYQGLDNFLRKSPWKASDLRDRRLEVILSILRGRSITLIIDETGDPKKGKTTDYVKRQYLGKLGKIENGIVAVTALGYLEGMTFPLTFEVFKPKGRLKEGDKYRTKPQIASKMVEDLVNRGFQIDLVLADSLYGESQENFITKLRELKLNYLVAIQSNHGVWLPKGQKVRANKWRKFERKMSNGRSENRYVREVIFGKRGAVQYWDITTDPETLPKNSTSFVMSRIPGVKYQEVGNLYGLRNWIEYSYKQSKQELGWADFRVRNYADIEKWWELVMSAYLLISLHSEQLNDFLVPFPKKLAEHEEWDSHPSWKTLLKNIRLMLEPFIYFNDLNQWLKVFPVPQISLGLPKLISLLDRFNCLSYLPKIMGSYYFSTA